MAICSRADLRTSARRILLPAIAVTVAMVLAACGPDTAAGTSPGPAPGLVVSPAPAAEPQTSEAARTAVDRAVARAAAGDNAGVWDLLIPEDQALVERGEYVAYQETCNSDKPNGLPYETVDFRLEDTSTAIAIVKVLGFTLPVHAFYREGRWLTRLTDENRAGVRQWTTDRSCLPDTS